jgi:hypothetical protein
MANGPGNFGRRLFVIRVAAPVPTLDHLHPYLAVGKQPAREGLSNRILRSVDFGFALVLKIIAERFPGEFVGELERLN